MATIYLNRGGTTLGTFSEDEVREGLRSGRLAAADLGWREGMGSWQPLSQFSEFATDLATSEAKPPAVTPPPVTSTITPSASVAAGKTEPLAIWSLVLSILSFVCCGFVLGIPGVICGHLALAKFRKEPHLEGKSMATAGVIIGYVSIACWLIYVVFFGGVAFLHGLTQGSSQ